MLTIDKQVSDWMTTQSLLTLDPTASVEICL